jgi:hypothetical protein
MPDTFTIILRECPPASRNGVAQFLGKAFSLKDSTCAAIASSAPIILVAGLAREEAAAMSLTLSGIQRLGGVLEFTTADQGDLPKIDWPKRPLVFKREITEHLEDLHTQVPLPGGRRSPVLELLIAGLGTQQVTVSGDLQGEAEVDVAVAIKPAAAKPAPKPAAAATATPAPAKFESMPLPEITPFSSPVVGGGAKAPAAPAPSAKAETEDAGALFPEEAEQGGFVPNNEDITNILDRLLPEDEAPAGGGKPATSGSRRSAAVGAAPAAAGGGGGGGYSVFLAKIGDEARRTKAVDLIAELAKIGKEEAEGLSKKVIIPVLKGASKDEAESAKQKFAKIGILARVKGPE